MTWKELLEQLPEDAHDRAARAGRRALERIEAPEREAKLSWLWAPALATVAVVAGAALWFQRAWQVEALTWQPPAPAVVAVAWQPFPEARRSVSTPTSRDRQGEPRRLQVQLALSDGTRIYWTFDDNFILRGSL